MSGIIVNEPPKRVAICVPSGDLCAIEFALCLQAMTQHIALKPPQGLSQISTHNVRNTILPAGRQSLVLAAMKAYATHILWIDSDMAFPRDTLHRLLAWRRSIVGINARMRKPPYRTGAQREDGSWIESGSGIEKVHRMGLGIVLMETDVFRKLELPYFEFPWVTPSDCRGEDYYLFEKCKSAGFDLWVDHDLSDQVAHMGVIPVQLNVSPHGS